MDAICSAAPPPPPQKSNMVSLFVPFHDPAARDASTRFPLEDEECDINSIPQDTLIAHGETAPVLHSLGQVKIVRLSKSLALKYGEGVHPSEGESMKYVAANYPGVRLPKVHRAFYVPEPLSHYGTRAYIIMKYVDGHSLDSTWSQLGPKVQKDVVTQVAHMVRELQNKHFPDPAVIGGGICRGYYFSDYGAGPFEKKADFEKWINFKLDLSKQFKRAAEDIPPITYDYFVFTHSDLSPRNLIFDSHGQLWLIDWGCSGIYPPIFETAILKQETQHPDFSTLLQSLIYNNDKEMRQLESCAYGIRVLTAAQPTSA